MEHIKKLHIAIQWNLERLVYAIFITFGSKKTSKLTNEKLLPQHEFDSEFCATEKYQKLSCVHGHTPTQCVCTEGFDIGAWFLSCPLEACTFVNWLDEQWHGRVGRVITKFVEDNVKLKKKLIDLECPISMMKQERINHRQQMKARYKKELACVLVVLALAIFCALFPLMVRGFV
ncbi:hypothetical protein ZWY2020_008165 [Hordeum vulgare]|nr:hypothetical protein ZWY2020_008165 [Hordeum vulgare]